MTDKEARLAIIGAISMELKNPTLQQGFEIICKKIAELEKENTELKEALKTYNGCGDWDNDFHTCRVYLQHEELQMYIEQLTKAKKLLKQFLEAKNGEDTYKAEWEAEQFLKDFEK
jgi:hypothetical protein